MELFTNHPEYPEKVEGVVDVGIIRNKLNPKYYELEIIKVVPPEISSFLKNYKLQSK